MVLMLAAVTDPDPDLYCHCSEARGPHVHCPWGGPHIHKIEEAGDGT